MAEKETAAPWSIPYPTSAGEAKLGATNMEEIANRVTTIFKEHLVTVVEHGSNVTAVSGELAKATAAITVTLPSAAANATVGILANGHAVTLAASGGAVIYGDAVEGQSSVALVGYQHIVVQADGTNWYIVSGAVKAVEAPFASSGHVKLQTGSASYSAAELGTGVSTQTITLPSAWPNAHSGFFVAMYGVTNSSKVFLRACGVLSASQGFFVPEMGGASQSLEVRWLSIGY